MLVVFVIGSTVAMMYGHQIQAEDLAKNQMNQTVPAYATSSNIELPFCYHNGTCSTAPRDYSVP